MSINKNKIYKIPLCSNRRSVWLVSILAVLISLIGFLFSSLNTSIGYPLRAGLDFTGGTQIKVERNCIPVDCRELTSTDITGRLKDISSQKEFNDISLSTSNIKVQLLDGSKSILLRLPFLSSSQTKIVVDSIDSLAGPLDKGGTSVDAIGPSLGKELLKSSLVSLLAAFTGISIYISFRFDKKYAFLALFALIHDITIVSGIFAWLGLIYQVEVDSLFAVALLTIAGYSVNDTVVIFDRIRELSKLEEFNNIEKIDIAVSASLTRTLYTSGSTLLPLTALIIFGGSTLKMFAIALAIGVIVGSWSSIALAPSLLSLSFSDKLKSN
tara:strand:+ start:446 stop:1423 length:978 start_codon:yes stop_codon:yes gene_type:complete